MLQKFHDQRHEALTWVLCLLLGEHVKIDQKELSSSFALRKVHFPDLHQLGNLRFQGSQSSNIGLFQESNRFALSQRLAQLNLILHSERILPSVVESLLRLNQAGVQGVKARKYTLELSVHYLIIIAYFH
jgi:hypothetical protein